ncbi:MAG: RecQ family ATP-dependent DNA helicase [Cytophagales bacterium]|nr:RecQ family ATP-dependent DNA helicase [Cytophagales bacterium]MDW8384707.1 ATP-dependent DNA helicase RecQ [Flammeovirgaceae bacterium]
MNAYLDILKKYWGYSQFRALQAEIIEHIGNGYDTLALLPTGGGKSICFQVPALTKEGICLVISPLVALMQDQVFQLQRRGIPAQMIHGAMNRMQIQYVLSNAQHRAIKFLYVSPERLQTELFRKTISYIPVSLLAVDEAHCISQWGYEFRPPYLAIGHFREEFLPEIPCIALTATATFEVREDIQKKLRFRKGSKVFQKSFARPNLSYSALYEENKYERLIQMLQKIQGSAVVYVRNRKKTQEVADFLQSHNIRADYYHAGLDAETRQNKQKSWIANQTRVIVATNAFGMGIDKPDVRLVVHLDLPDSLEAYYQEAGRAGRDEKKAFAVVLYTQEDLQAVVKNIERSYPTLEEIKEIYHALGNYLQIPIGEGEMNAYDFSLTAFAKTYQFSTLKVLNALQKLEEAGLLLLSENIGKLSQVRIKVSQQALHEFQNNFPQYRPLINCLLRHYGGALFHYSTPIFEDEMSRYTNLSQNALIDSLRYLHKLEIIDYEEKTEKPQIIYLQPRYSKETLPLNAKIVEMRRALLLNKALSVARYVDNSKQCRTSALLEYFGEIANDPCGICDVCVYQKRSELTEVEIISKIRSELLKKGKTKVSDLLYSMSGVPQERVFQAIRILSERKEIEIQGLYLQIKP